MEDYRNSEQAENTDFESFMFDIQKRLSMSQSRGSNKLMSTQEKMKLSEGANYFEVKDLQSNKFETSNQIS